MSKLVPNPTLAPWCVALWAALSTSASVASLPQAAAQVEVRTCSENCFLAEPDDVSLLQVINRQEKRKGVPVSATPLCATSQRLLRPGLAGAALALAVLGVLALCKARWNATEFAQAVFCLNVTLSMMIFSATIVESYQLAHELGRSVAWSGLSVGFTPATSVVGSLAGWASMSRHSQCTSISTYLILSCLCALAGGLLYSLVTFSLAGFAPLLMHKPALLLAARGLGGFASGLFKQYSYTTAVVISSHEERVRSMVLLALGAMLGIGLGPLAVAWMSLFDACRGQPPDYLLGGPVWILVAMTGLGASFAYRMVEAEVGVKVEEQLEVVQNKEDRVVVLVTLVLTFLRGFVVAGLEVATAMLLEHRHGWPHGRIGAVIGVSFLTCIPVCVVHRIYFKGVPVPTSSRILAAFVVLGSVLLLDIWQPFGEAVTIASLVGGDVLLFPFLYLADAIMIGVRMQKAGPSGSVADENSIVLYTQGLTSLARLAGPWLSRYLLDHGGRSIYASVQALAVLLFVLLTEFVVVPRI